MTKKTIVWDWIAYEEPENDEMDPTPTQLILDSGDATIPTIFIMDDDVDPAVADKHAEMLVRAANAMPALVEACEAILAGWGHQDGISKAVELARAAVALAKQ